GNPGQMAVGRRRHGLKDRPRMRHSLLLAVRIHAQHHADRSVGSVAKIENEDFLAQGLFLLDAGIIGRSSVNFSATRHPAFVSPYAAATSCPFLPTFAALCAALSASRSALTVDGDSERTMPLTSAVPILGDQSMQ